MNWDAEIWAPCRLGEAFTLREFGSEHTEYLYAIKADWMGQHGDAMTVRFPENLSATNLYNVRIGAGPRPWGSCWTYEAVIKITPPVWCWDMQEDTMFGLDLKPKRNGKRRKVRLDCVMIHLGRPVYRLLVEHSDGNQYQFYDSLPVLDPYFAPIWPQAVAEAPAQEPTATAAAETPTPEVVINPPCGWIPEPVESPIEETAQERIDQVVDVLDAAACEFQIIGATTRDALQALKAAIINGSGKEEPVGIPWDSLENRPPGTRIGEQTTINRNYYYYVWLEEPPAEGETYEQKTGP